MVLKKIAALLAAGLCFAGVLSAEELTVDRAVKYALENNISVQKDKITLDALKREKKSFVERCESERVRQRQYAFSRCGRCASIRLQFFDSRLS